MVAFVVLLNSPTRGVPVSCLALFAGLWGCSSSPAPTTPRGEAESVVRAPVEELPPEDEPEIDVTLTYLANEGVLLRGGETVVVIDGLHRFYGEAYDVLPEEERERLEAAQGEYAGVDVLLATHRHGDHFHPEATLRHLRANTSATFIAAAQATEELAALAGAGPVMSRVRGVEWRVGEAERLDVGGARVEVLGLRHAGTRHATVESLGAVVTLGGVAIAHFGDAEGSAENLAPFGLRERHLGGAVVPAWWVLEEASRQVIRDQIAPQTLFVAHVDATDPEAPARLAEAWPGAVVLHEKLEQYRLGRPPAPRSIAD